MLNLNVPKLNEKQIMTLFYFKKYAKYMQLKR